MSFFKFLRNLFGSSETTEETVQTKVVEPESEVSNTVSISEAPTKVVEPEKNTDEQVKTAKEIKAKVRRPENSNNQAASKPRPKRRRPSTKKPKSGE